ncbi:MAG: tyrosine-type recombinase/integrase [Clostridia bacterium]
MAVKTNVNKNGNKYFRITRTIGHKEDGTPVKKEFYGNSKSDAEEKAQQYISDLKNGLIASAEDYTVSQLMKIWLFDFLNNSASIKPSTFQRYEGIYRNYIKKSPIAGTKITKLNSIQIQKYYNDLSKDKTYTQINTLHTILKVFLNWCCKSGYLIKNPCLNLNLKGNKTDIINQQRKEVEILNQKEINIIKKYIKDSDFELLFLLDLGTGLRLGELLALDWEHINLKSKELTVEKSVKEVYIYDSADKKHIETIIQTPKTRNSFRTIPIPSSLIDILNKVPKKKGYLFLDKNGELLKGKNVSSKWTKILKECNIPHKKFHSIRHTYGSMLLQKGVDIETVAELMGHTAISITQMYMHSETKIKSKSVNKLNSILN